MARKSLLSEIAQQNREEKTYYVVPDTTNHKDPIPEKKPPTNKGKYHLGGYYATDLPEIEHFRILSVKLRRSQQDLLIEAVRDLIDKHNAREKFGG